MPKMKTMKGVRSPFTSAVSKPSSRPSSRGGGRSGKR